MAITTVDQLLRSPSTERRYLLRLSPYSIDAEDTVDFYLSNGEFSTQPADTPPSRTHIPVLREIPQFRRSIGDTLSGITTIDLGRIVIADNGRFNAWADRGAYIWGGYEFELKVGAPYFAYSAFETVIKGVILDMEYTIAEGDRREIILRVGSKDVFLTQKVLQQNRYDSSVPNGDLENAVIPKCYGEVYNIQPVLFNQTSLIYQVNDGQIEDVVMVYDRNVNLTHVGTASAGAGSTITLAGSASAVDSKYVGAEITITGGTGVGQTRTISGYVGATKVATVSVAWGVNPNATSQYSVNLFVKDLTNGKFTLINQPTSTSNITADVKGDKRGGTYRYQIATIVQEILTQSGGLVSGDLDSGTFSGFPNTATVGWYFKDEIKVVDAIKIFLETAGASAGRSRTGLYQLIRLDEPSGDSDIDLTDLQIFSVDRAAFKPPVASVTVGWRKNFTSNTTVTTDETAATTGRIAFVAKEFREAISVTGGASAAYLLAQEPILIESAFTNEADAITEANRRASMFGKPSDIFEVIADSNPFKRQLGDIVNVTYNAYDLSTGVDMVLIGIDPDISLGTRIKLTLWRNVA